MIVSHIVLLRKEALVALRREGVLSPSHWQVGVWSERTCECFSGVELISTIFN